MKNFTQLKKNLKADFSQKQAIKVAILGDSATQFYAQAMRGLGFDMGFDLRIFEADFNQIAYQVFTPDSDLYAFQPEIIILFQSTHKLLNQYNKLSTNNSLVDFAHNHILAVREMIETIQAQSTAKIIYFNFPEIDDAVFGSYANKIEFSFLFQIRKLNYELMVLAKESSSFFICDLSSLQNQLSKEKLFHPSVYVNTEMVLSIDAIPFVAKKTIDIVAAIHGQICKCLVLDLDNTLWGGVIGDDGLDHIEIGSLGIGKAFTEFQYWLKKLKNRGILLAVCSKNTESVAKEPFEKHPEMVLHLDDFAIFVANWENKADNIRYIQSVLNIGFDSMGFLDDNPFERDMVRQHIPGIVVPELPEDPAEYLEYLYTLNLFETVNYSSEDKERTKQYQIENQRAVLQEKFADEDKFLQSLDMFSVVESFNKFNTPRVAQLSQRSNQFNLRTVRYTESDIEHLSQQEDCLTLAFTLTDKFGDNGLICVCILRKEDTETLFIDTWFMSCRVLKRGMESFTLNTIVDLAREKGYQYLKGQYIPTAKNEMVKDYYKNLGFEQMGNFWILDINQYQPRKCYITKK